MQNEYTVNRTEAVWRLYEQMDQARCWQGRVLDALGCAPLETPSRLVLRRPGVTLKGYGDASGAGPVILMVPAPIKRAYIWDLAPGASVVEHCLAHGLRPYLVQWEEPEPDTGLADYADRLLGNCVHAIQAETGEERMFLAGHSLGGLFAAIFASLHPAPVRGLIVVTSPLHFEYGPGAGALGPVMAKLAHSDLLRSAPGNVPGSFLSMASFMASPAAFGRERYADWLKSLADGKAVQTHLRVERWSLDELPLARRLVADLVTQLYGEDGFLRGTLALAECRASAREVVAPLLAVGDARCTIVPPAAILPVYETAGSAEKRLLWYKGDVGVAIQHVGVLVGRNAHRTLWPGIVRWMHRHWEA